MTDLRALVARISPFDAAEIERKYNAITSGWKTDEERFTSSTARPVSDEVWRAATGQCAPREDKEPSLIARFPKVQDTVAEIVHRKTFGKRNCIYCKEEYVVTSQTQLICGKYECKVKRNTDNQTAHRKRKKVNKEDCKHDGKWVRQALTGKYARYERCEFCKQQRVVGGNAMSPGRKRNAPVMDKANCPHKPEWVSNVNNHGKPAQRCRACATVRVKL